MQCQLMKVEGVMELDNYHLAKIIVIIDSERNYLKTSKNQGESLMRKKLFTKSQSTSDKILTTKKYIVT